MQHLSSFHVKPHKLNQSIICVVVHSRVRSPNQLAKQSRRENQFAVWLIAQKCPIDCFIESELSVNLVSWCFLHSITVVFFCFCVPPRAVIGRKLIAESSGFSLWWFTENCGHERGELFDLWAGNWTLFEWKCIWRECGKFISKSTLNVRTCCVTKFFSIWKITSNDYVQPARQTQLTSGIDNCKKIDQTRSTHHTNFDI